MSLGVAAANSSQAGIVGTLMQLPRWLGHAVVDVGSTALRGGRDVVVAVVSNLWRLVAPALGLVWAAVSSNVGLVILGVALTASLVVLHHKALQDRIKAIVPGAGSLFDAIHKHQCIAGTAYLVLLVGFGVLLASSGVVPVI